MKEIVVSASFPLVFFWPFIYSCNPKVFETTNVYRNLKSLDIFFQRL